MLLAIIAQPELLLALAAHCHEGTIARLFNHFLLEEIIHKLARIHSFNGLILKLLNLMVKLINLSLLGPHDIFPI